MTFLQPVVGIWVLQNELLVLRLIGSEFDDFWETVVDPVT